MTVDDGDASIVKQLRFGQGGEVARCIRVIDAVVIVTRICAQHRVIDKIAAFSVVVVWVPDDLRCPHTIDFVPVSKPTLALWVNEDGIAFAEVESGGCPVNEIIGTEQIDAIVEPRTRFAVAHIGGHHQVVIVLTPIDECIAHSSLNACHHFSIVDGLVVE